MAPPPRTGRTRPGRPVKAIPSGSSTPRPGERLGRSKHIRAGFVWSLRLSRLIAFQVRAGVRGTRGVRSALPRRPCPMSCRRQQIESSGWAPQVRVCAHMPGSHVHISFFFASTPSVFYQACQLFKGSTAPAEPRSPVNQADFGTYLLDYFSPRSTHLFTHGCQDLTLHLLPLPWWGQLLSLHLVCIPICTKVPSQGEVQVSAGEVYISTVLPD